MTEREKDHIGLRRSLPSMSRARPERLEEPSASTLESRASARDFHDAVRFRGGIVHLCRKGEPASEVELSARFVAEENTFVWLVRLAKQHYDSSVAQESVSVEAAGRPPRRLLSVRKGEGWWLSKQKSIPEQSERPWRNLD